MAGVPYAYAVGSLMYAMVCTQPDIAYSVSMVSRFMSNPEKSHWQALKGILRYIKGSLGKGLVIGGADGKHDKLVVIEGFVDYDFVGCLDTRKSLTAYVFTAVETAIAGKLVYKSQVAMGIGVHELDVVQLVLEIKVILDIQKRSAKPGVAFKSPFRNDCGPSNAGVVL
ncbi:secreted RxLR effector protein 161-like [Humulus lupulus]|uniref:secreted RxLR effector protein 161-like n=1 Tax=Humulus lupulus TaxID=3486 RepID=UPI002B412876|nr:secreted RxLR effector protein 161-like [Humulus lupulus]